MVADAEGGFLLVGDGIFVLKIDGEGNKVSEERFSGVGTADAWDIIPSGGGGFVVFGFTEDDQRIGGGYLFMIDREGNTIWEKVLPHGYGTCIAGTKDGGYLTISVGEYVHVWRLDGEGNPVWNRTYPAASGVWRIRDMVETGDGGYLVVGIVEYGSAINQHVYLLRIGPEGEKVWENVWDRVWFDRATAHSVVQSGDGGFVIAGDKNDDAYVCRIDGEGNRIWERTYGTNRSENIMRIIRTYDGGFVLVGESGGYTEGGHDIYLLKVDGDGNKVWERTYGGEGSEFGAAVVEVSPDCYLIAGTAESLDDRYSVYLVKTCLGMPVPLAGSPSVAFLVVSVLAVLPIASKRAPPASPLLANLAIQASRKP